MLVAKFFIYFIKIVLKYSTLKPSILKYFNVLNMIKKSQYITAKRNNNISKHYKKSK